MNASTAAVTVHAYRCGMEPMSAPTAPTIHAERAVPPHTPTMTAPARVGDAVLSELCGGAPESIPEALLFLTMTQGVLDGAHRAMDELEQRLAHVLRDVEPSPPLNQGLPRHPETPLGQRTLGIYEQASALESRVHSVRNRLEV